MSMRDILLARAMGGGSGGSGGGGLVKLVSEYYKSRFVSSFGAYTVYVSLGYDLSSIPKVISITYDGMSFNHLQVMSVNIPAFGGMLDLCGNLSLLNTILGTSFENTGEPFFASVMGNGVQFFVLDTEETKHTVAIYVPLANIKGEDRGHLPEFQDIDFIELGLPVLSKGTKHHNIISEDQFNKVLDAVKCGVVSIRFKASGQCDLGGEQVSFTIDENDIITGVCCGLHLKRQSDDIVAITCQFGSTYHFVFNNIGYNTHDVSVYVAE